MRVAIVAEWYPSPADPVHGIWAHRQAAATMAAGAELQVLALRRPVPPLATLRRLAGTPPDTRPLRRWACGVRDTLRPFELEGVRVNPVPFAAPPRPWSYGAWGYWAAPALGRALRHLRQSWPFDLVHAHCITPAGYAAVRWARRAGAPVAVSAHGPDMINVPDRSRFARSASRIALREADLVIANSRWAERRCAEIAGRTLPRSRVIHLGAELPSVLPAKHERPTVVTLAHLVARKRHVTVLHALAELRGRLELDYLVIGDGPGREPLERLANELGLRERVRFLGQLPNREAVQEARRCHVFVMPGVEEPFGVAFVEAMAGRLPAIGARGEGGPEDIAAAGEGMTLVPPDDHRALAQAIEQVFAAGPERLGAAARATVERCFTWERCGLATVSAYESILR